MSFCSCIETVCHVLPFLSLPSYGFSPTMHWLFADPGTLQLPSIGSFPRWFSLSSFEPSNCAICKVSLTAESDVCRIHHVRKAEAYLAVVMILLCPSLSVQLHIKQRQNERLRFFCLTFNSRQQINMPLKGKRRLSFYFPHPFPFVEDCFWNTGMLTMRQGLLT